jgi:hypothetical protein
MALNLNFATAIAALGGDPAMFQVANQARPSSDYLGGTLLPEKNKASYSVDSGYMTIRTTMAGLASMDSPYPPSGAAQASAFNEKTAKVANTVELSEEAQRSLHDFLLRMTGESYDTNRMIGQEVLNFYDKLVIQAHLDTAEMLRWQALANGALSWTYNGATLSVDYGIPAENFITPRTDAANNAYFDSGSLFWADHRAAMKRLRNNVAGIFMSTDMLYAIIDNPVNNIEVAAQNGNVFDLRRYVERAGGTVTSTDARDRTQVIVYDLEGEMIDPTTPGGTIPVRFLPNDKIVYVGRPTRGGYRVGEGATESPETTLAIGYTHLAPTVEGGGAAGRWGRAYTPPNEPWILRGQGVSNLLPVIENPLLVCVLESEVD